MDIFNRAIGHVHVWHTRLDLEPAMLYRLESTLSADEKQRASQFYFPRDRRRFVAGRGLVRDILARYTDADPAELQFTYNDYGKPRLRQLGRADAIRFNLSHSNEIGVLAVSRERDVGIDIETLRGDTSILDVADSFFSRNEVLRLFALPKHLRCEAFYRCWVRKEAYIKARGMGLSIPLHSFEVSLSPGFPAELLASTEPSDVSAWKLENLEVDDGYIAAVAAHGKDWTLQQRGWNPVSDGEVDEPL